MYIYRLSNFKQRFGNTAVGFKSYDPALMSSVRRKYEQYFVSRQSEMNCSNQTKIIILMHCYDGIILLSFVNIPFKLIVYFSGNILFEFHL